MVSYNYLQKVDPHWESNISVLGPNLWKGDGSSLQPSGNYTTNVVIGHPRGNISCKMTFVVMANENLPNYFIFGIDNIRLFGIKLNVCGNFFTFGGNLKRHFQFQCTEESRRVLSLNMQDDGPSPIIAQPGEQVGEPTSETDEFKKALQASLRADALSKEYKGKILKVIHQFPMVFAHGSRQLGEISIR